MSAAEVAAAAREVARGYGCSGTREGDLIADAFERFADKLDGDRLCGVCARPIAECRCGGDEVGRRLRRLVEEMAWCEREHPDALVSGMDVRAVREYAKRREGFELL